MTAAQLVVLRHGRTSWNATGRLQGQADIPLDDRGVAQAAQAAGVLAELAPAVSYSSDLARARQPAGPLHPGSLCSVSGRHCCAAAPQRSGRLEWPAR